MGCCGGKEEGMLNEPLEARRIIAMQGIMRESDDGVQQHRSNEASPEKTPQWQKEEPPQQQLPEFMHPASPKRQMTLEEQIVSDQQLEKQESGESGKYALHQSCPQVIVPTETQPQNSDWAQQNYFNSTVQCNGLNRI